MKPADLRDLAAKATPGPWLRHEHNQVWVHHDRDPSQPPATKVAQCIFGDDARLIALAPQLAVLCADMADALHAWEGDEAVDALLARLEALT